MPSPWPREGADAPRQRRGDSPPRSASISDLRLVFEARRPTKAGGVQKDMEEKRPSRLVGSKVSQIANIFQSMAPAKETELLLSSTAVPLRNHQPASPRAERRRTVAGGDDPGPQRESPVVTVVRTESHVARFNNARALFEKLGSEDSKAKPAPGQLLTASSQNLHSRSSSDNSSAGTSPVRASRPLSSRSPSPRVDRSPVVSSNGFLATTDGDLRKKDYNGLERNGLIDATDEDSTPVATKIPSIHAAEKLRQTRPVRQVDGHKTNGVVKFGGDDQSKEHKALQLNATPAKAVPQKPEKPDKPDKPDKPEKPERKFNSRELIEKQRNWTSHFSKSRAARYNSDPNKSEVRVGVGTRRDPQVAVGVEGAAPATRSASFSATRTLRSPATSPPPPPGPSPAGSPVVSEDKLERETCRLSPSPTPSSTSPSTCSEEKESQLVSLQGAISSTSSSPLSPGRSGDSSDGEKRAREEDSGEVRRDVAHVEKRTKMVSSVQLTLQASRPASAPGDDPPPGGEQPAITNSVLRELESDSTDHTALLPADKYTEFTTDGFSACVDKVQVSPGSGKYPFQLDDGHKIVDKGGGAASSSPESESREDGGLQREVGDGNCSGRDEEPPARGVDAGIVTAFIESERHHADRASPCVASPRTSVPRDSVDVIGGSEQVASPAELSPNLPALSPAALGAVPQGWGSASSAEMASPSADDSMRASSSVASILDLQDVEYADADAEDGDDEAERDDFVVQEPLKQSFQVADAVSVPGPAAGFEPDSLTVVADAPDTMTPDEAENLLSSRILEKKIRQESLLSDEEAHEVTRLLSPTDDKEHEDPDWLADVLSCTSDSLLQESTLDYRSRSELSVTMEDSLTSSHACSRSGSEFGLLGSVSSLNDGEPDPDCRRDDATPQPGRVVVVENGVHYFEDGHFWMEVPGLPESEEEDDLDFPVAVKKSSRVTFSTGPIKVYSTFSVTDYDRRNEDVDPVAASAEYELEKRVEKMEVFPVELTKGPEGLGLSIIGMGVGADAGLEKLGIFVKTITDLGAAARDSRIQVNDQIIEVDGKSLVGVTQAYAASVLRNTCGLVKFLIGRERDPENSEVAQLIKQSLQADREREEQRRQAEQPARGAASPDSSATLPLSGTSPTASSSSSSSSSEGGLASPPDAGGGSVFERDDASPQSPGPGEADAIRALLQETQLKDGEISRLKAQLAELERSGAGREEMMEKLQQASAKLREAERGLHSARKDASAYQDMLEQSQGQYAALERKYGKAKKLLREFQQREQDLIHREEFHLQLLQEKDTEYNALVKTLKDRVIQLEQELLETQRKAGFPAVLPYDNSSLRQLTPQLSRRHQPPPVKPLLQQLETELSDTEISDISPEDGDKTATVERKMPVKEELDRAVPPHELLDVSASKAKAELATRGGLAGRQLPSGKKGSGGLSSSSSDYGLDESRDGSGDEESDKRRLYIEYAAREEPPSRVHGLVSQFSAAGAALYAPAAPLPHPHHPHRRQPAPSLAGPPPSLAEQLRQVLAERERRASGAGPRDDLAEGCKGVSQQLAEEIRQAVSEANARVKKVSPQTLLPPATQAPWQPQASPLRDGGPPSPSVSSSGSVSSGVTTADPSPSRPVATDAADIWSPPHPQDLGSGFSAEKKGSHYWQSAPINDWSVEQCVGVSPAGVPVAAGAGAGAADAWVPGAPGGRRGAAAARLAGPEGAGRGGRRQGASQAQAQGSARAGGKGAAPGRQGAQGEGAAAAQGREAGREGEQAQVTELRASPSRPDVGRCSDRRPTPM
ncbi:uncharacterized protein LOC134538193 isoform X3 [Bacillus rossius redtenbacheri]|uniref:uncharacterized protein LOC134538193 isoform X3 n=1 Tax=Bacillus rossius redtenbacheri TaxID=93214 RepID=UPI002FDD66AB